MSVYNLYMTKVTVSILKATTNLWLMDINRKGLQPIVWQFYRCKPLLESPLSLPRFTKTYNVYSLLFYWNVIIYRCFDNRECFYLYKIRIQHFTSSNLFVLYCFSLTKIFVVMRNIKHSFVMCHHTRNKIAIGETQIEKHDNILYLAIISMPVIYKSYFISIGNQH